MPSNSGSFSHVSILSPSRGVEGVDSGGAVGFNRVYIRKNSNNRQPAPRKRTGLATAMRSIDPSEGVSTSTTFLEVDTGIARTRLKVGRKVLFPRFPEAYDRAFFFTLLLQHDDQHSQKAMGRGGRNLVRRLTTMSLAR